ncbi:hypothetical protein Hanom_Chr04g00306371 [Helianthus anomalus]
MEDITKTVTNLMHNYSYIQVKLRCKNTNLGNSKSRAPLFLQNVKTNAAIAVDVRVEDLRPESHLRKDRRCAHLNKKHSKRIMLNLETFK